MGKYDERILRDVVPPFALEHAGGPNNAPCGTHSSAGSRLDAGCRTQKSGLDAQTVELIPQMANG